MKNKTCKLFQQSVKCVDVFGVRIGFHLNGMTHIKSLPGLIMTMFVFSVLITYIVEKFHILISHSNPTISTATFKNYYDFQRQLNLEDIGFKVAFGIEDGHKNFAPLDDPNFSRWEVSMVTSKFGLLIN